MSTQILCGIYVIRNTVNGKRYVGSAVDIRKRWQGHKSDLNEGVHHCRYLQRAWIKHGEIAFVFEFIEAVERNKKALNAREQVYIDEALASGLCYNVSPTARSCLGIKRSPEFCAKKRKRLRDGERFSRWVVIGFAGMRSGYRSYYHCRCDCGEVGIVWQQDLRGNKSRSCGCLQRETIGNSRRKHSMSKSSEHESWLHMKSRSGIIVCQRWRDSFGAFYEDMGPRPSPGWCLVRVDNDGSYDKVNCRWAPRKEKNRNRHDNHWIEFNGQRAIIGDWARSLGISAATLRGRLGKLGWPLARALTEPPRRRMAPI